MGQTGRRPAWKAPLLPALLHGARPAAIWGPSGCIWAPQDLGLGGGWHPRAGILCRAGVSSGPQPPTQCCPLRGHLTSFCGHMWPLCRGLLCSGALFHLGVPLCPAPDVPPGASPPGSLQGGPEHSTPGRKRAQPNPTAPGLAAPAWTWVRDGGKQATRGQKA